MKKWIVAAAAAGMSVLFSVTPFAAGWELGTGEHASQWRYVNADNSVDKGWHVIDGNGDGIAEWYYFNEEGWLLTSATTPDGYTVNENGAWVKDGQVMTEKVGGAQAAEAGTKASAAAQMPQGKYFMYNVVNNGVTQKLSMNVLYQSFYEFASVTDKSVVLQHTVTDTYGVSTQMYVTFDKQADGTYTAKVDEGYTLLQMNPEEKWIYVGEPDFSRGHIYLLESEM